MISIQVSAQSKIGVIVSLEGNGWLRDANGSVRRLTGRNFAVPLVAGQSLRSEGRGAIYVKLCNGRTEKITNAWYRISASVCPSTASPEKRRILETIFEFGGRYKVDRGIRDLILLPREGEENSIVRPGSAVIRWNSGARSKLRVTVAIPEGRREVWSQEVRGEEGAVISSELRKRLEALRQTDPEKSVELELNIEYENIMHTARFRLLSLRDEKRLNNKLSLVTNETGLYKFIARAVAFSEFGLLDEAANEFEVALKFSPESKELLIAAARAQDRAGNIRRKLELIGLADALKD
jgi:hypothetical protein